MEYIILTVLVSLLLVHLIDEVISSIKGNKSFIQRLGEKLL